jgi:hypothetical protein
MLVSSIVRFTLGIKDHRVVSTNLIHNELRIKLDARTAILGICKTSGAGGPGYFNCENLGAPCESAGS